MNVSTLLFKDIKHLDFERKWNHNFSKKSFNIVLHDSSENTIRFPYKTRSINNITLYSKVILKYKNFINKILLERNEIVKDRINYNSLELNINDLEDLNDFFYNDINNLRGTNTTNWGVCLYLRNANFDEYISLKEVNNNILNW